jgi:hypothetical protein
MGVENPNGDFFVRLIAGTQKRSHGPRLEPIMSSSLLGFSPTRKRPLPT